MKSSLFAWAISCDLKIIKGMKISMIVKFSFIMIVNIITHNTFWYCTNAWSRFPSRRAINNYTEHPSSRCHSLLQCQLMALHKANGNSLTYTPSFNSQLMWYLIHILYKLYIYLFEYINNITLWVGSLKKNRVMKCIYVNWYVLLCNMCNTSPLKGN